MTTRLKSLSLWLLIVTVLVPTAMADDPPKPDKPGADSMLGKEAGDVRDDNGLKMKLVWCPPGFLKMEEVEPRGRLGLEGKMTPVRVWLSHGYWLARHEVTQAAWRHVMGTEPWKNKDHTQAGNDFPATWVSWHESMDFCRKLTNDERDAGRLDRDWEYSLPTEAQWERACRAGTDTRFSFGDNEAELGQHAWFRGNAWKIQEEYAHRVGQKKPNGWGLHDMHGNVKEWCRDEYSPKLLAGQDPFVTKGISGNVFRGGDWASEPATCTSAYRSRHEATFQYRTVGFRIALVPVQPAK